MIIFIMVIMVVIMVIMVIIFISTYIIVIIRPGDQKLVLRAADLRSRENLRADKVSFHPKMYIPPSKFCIGKKLSIRQNFPNLNLIVRLTDVLVGAN